MEWFTNIAPSLAGLPRWEVFVIVVLTIGLTKGVPALLKFLGFGFEREKYRDGLKKAERDALVTELTNRIEKLEEQQTKTLAKLEASQAAHAKCEIEQAKLQGKLDTQAERMNAMQIQIDSLLLHDKNNLANVKVIKQAVKQIDPTAELP